MSLNALVLLIFTLLAPCVFAGPPVHAIPHGFNESRGFGPDGPWQAVFVAQPYTSLSNGDLDRWIMMYPDNRGPLKSIVPLKEACYPYDNTSVSCGQGGFWKPSSSDKITVKEVTTITQNFSVPNKDYQILGQLQQSLLDYEGLMENISLVVQVSGGGQLLANGTDVGMDVGILRLGDPTMHGQVQDHSGGYSTLSWLFSHNKIPTYTFGLHIGSFALKYPGSLYYGGYDKGRTLGPYTTFDQYTTLLDIEFDVALGSLPSGFTPKRNIMSEIFGQDSRKLPLVELDTVDPYIAVPRPVCDTLASFLPIYFDHNLQYWLWKTDDPKYASLVQSPAYLGFVFPPAPGNRANVTIKVPLILLNLTLTEPITPKDLSYFPCNTRPVSEQYNRISLGRAFLQAAFMGTNYVTGISWLAQAPGPGMSGKGLGFEPTDITSDSTALETFADDDGKLFIESWKPFWKVLGNGSTNAKNSITKLSTAAKASIGIGVSIFVLVALALAFLYYRSPRSLHDSQDMKLDEASEIDEKVEPNARSRNHELYADPSCNELAGHENAVELPTNDIELPANNVDSVPLQKT